MAAKGKTLLAVADGRRAGLEALTGREVAISDAAAMRRIVLPDVPGKLDAGGPAAIPGKPVEPIRVDADMVVAPVEIAPEELGIARIGHPARRLYDFERVWTQSSPTTDTTRERCNTTLAIRTFSTPCATPRWQPIGSVISGGKRRAHWRH